MSGYLSYFVGKRLESNPVKKNGSSVSAVGGFSAEALAELQGLAVEICQVAGERLLEVYNSDVDLATELKDDNSPVTKADREVDEFLIAEFGKRTSYPVITEETQPPLEERSQYEACWLIDPLDGTQNFINRDGEFCIAVAFVADSVPLIGVISVPAQETIYLAYRGGGASKLIGDTATPITHSCPQRSYLVVDSKLPSDSGKYLTEQFCIRSSIPVNNIHRVGSAYKLGRMAAGEFDVAVRFDPMGEWDVAAADCILRETGCFLVDITTNESIRYNRRPTLMLQGYLAARADLEFNIT